MNEVENISKSSALWDLVMSGVGRGILAGEATPMVKSVEEDDITYVIMTSLLKAVYYRLPRSC